MAKREKERKAKKPKHEKLSEQQIERLKKKVFGQDLTKREQKFQEELDQVFTA